MPLQNYGISHHSITPGFQSSSGAPFLAPHLQLLGILGFPSYGRRSADLHAAPGKLCRMRRLTGSIQTLHTTPRRGSAGGGQPPVARSLRRCPTVERAAAELRAKLTRDPRAVDRRPGPKRAGSAFTAARFHVVGRHSHGPRFAVRRCGRPFLGRMRVRCPTVRVVSTARWRP